MIRQLSTMAFVAFSIIVFATMATLIPSVVRIPPTRGTATGEPPSHAIWQIAVSENCNDREACRGESFLGQPFTVGGLWGWMELSRGGTGQAEFTACHRSNTVSGASHDTVHVSVDITGWEVGSSGTFVILSGSEAVRGGAGAGTTLNIVGPVDTGIPAIPGHYSSLPDLSTSSGTGIHLEIEVVASASS